MTFSLNFFEVSAQLIPVLFLAMVVEERLQPEAEETASERVMRSWLLALLLIGEVISLSVVAGGIEPSKSAGSFVGAAMLGAGFLLVVPVLGRELKEERTRSERFGHALSGVVVLIALLGTLIAVQVS
jgi:hypothetical protein